ncbi:MAG: primosomal protein N' (replication factor Y) - superfamily II helicase [Pseudomonadota bacterium]
MPKETSRPGTSRFPCGKCGALQTYAPGSGALECPYCGFENEIEASDAAIVEYNFREALERLSSAPPADTLQTSQCENCAAVFNLEKNVHSGECPFCGTPVVKGTGINRHIKPESLLPFALDENTAKKRFRQWIGKLWFAPGKIQKFAREDTGMTGVYVPYWTYDSHTASSYSGQRGDAYYVQQRYTVMVDGRPRTRTRTVRKVRWTPVRGRVARAFDDVLVGASRSLPRTITERIAPWDLENLVPYDPKFLSGFRSEVYQVGLDEGFETAVNIMDRVIRQDVARDIGGDHQRIHRVDTRHSDTTYKHLLLPVWSAAFRFRDKSYRFVVNGRTGKVQGERPYSVAKIAAAVVGGAAALAILLFVMHETGALEEIMRSL